MKRVIKFKGKRLADGQWVYGHLAEIDEQPAILTGSIEWIDGYELRGICWELIDPSTVCQFTGLTDAQGKEIYEGDILMCVGQRIDNKGRAYFREVLFENGCFRMAITEYCLSSPMSNHIVNGTLKWEIVGNIHDNPDLLKGGSQ